MRRRSILCLTISGEMSAVYLPPRACRNVPRQNHQRVDTPYGVIWRGLMAIEAAKAIADGASMDEAVAAAEILRDRTTSLRPFLP